MRLSEAVRGALWESALGRRMGDKREEVETVARTLLEAEDLVVVTSNEKKVKAVNEVLREFGMREARPADLPTDMADATPCPALFKAVMGVQATDADVVIARGRLGVPGSGAMTVLMDSRCRVLTAALSPPHPLHGMDVEEAVRRELREALSRVIRSKG
ncbi:MAG: DUF3236 domain-containing protein [Methanopyri archaeon]|nr:DUF3236 domain-containing protein [Methanopyri archaeon]